MSTQHPATWPPRLHPGAVRFAHHSGRYEVAIVLYRDLVGLPVVGEFAASFGEDGRIFGLPDTSIQLEIVRARDPNDAPGTFNQLVLYLDNAAAVTAATAPLTSAGITPVGEPHPNWADRGAQVFSDPDGRTVVFAPWVYGRDPEPTHPDRACEAGPGCG